MVQAESQPVVAASVPQALPVPVVDLSLPEEAAAEAVRRACTEHGFMYVTHHEVPEDVISEQFLASREFFALPTEAKLAVEADAKSRGYTPLGEQTLDPANQKKGDTKESYYVWEPDVPAGSKEAELPFHGPNQWPDASLAPRFKPAMLAYMQHLSRLSARVTRLLALALDLPADHFEQYFRTPLLTLRPIHYTAELSSPTEGVLGAGAHTDWGFCTFLVGDGSPGLQLRLNGEWLNVPSLPGAFLVNLGDMLNAWTNERFKSTLHRVVNLVPGHERYSCALFTAPSQDARIECLPTCNPAASKYEPVTCAEYLQSKYAQTHRGFAERNQKEQ